MFTWFGPGSRRQSVSALRNSSWSSHRRRSTSTRWAQADNPPPKLASAMARNAVASAAGVGRGAGSLMKEVGIVRQLAHVVRVERERVGWVPVLRLVPVVLEELAQPLDDGVGLHDDAELAAQVEGAAIEIHRAEERRFAIGEEELGVNLQVLLAAHLDVGAFEDPQRGERVVHVPRAEAMLAPAEHAHAHPSVLRAGEPVDDGGVDELRVLHVERVFRAIDEAGDQAAGVVGTPD